MLSPYRLVNELDAIDCQHQQHHAPINLIPHGPFFFFCVWIIMCMEDFQRVIAVVDLFGEEMFVTRDRRSQLKFCPGGFRTRHCNEFGEGRERGGD